MHFRYTYQHDYLLLWHSDQPPEEETWRAYVKEAINRPLLKGLLVQSQWMPTDNFRQDVFDTCPAVPVAVLCDLTSMWLMATSFRWVWERRGARAEYFEPGDFENAFDFLGIPQGLRKELRDTSMKLSTGEPV